MMKKTKVLIIIFLLFSSVLILSFQIDAVLSQTTSITKPIQAAGFHKMEHCMQEQQTVFTKVQIMVKLGLQR
jgi:hypothetical protein